MENIRQFSPNMLKTFEICPRKFFYKYVKNISMPINDEIFEFGKNIHALASYYLKKENIDNMEKSLSERERKVWEYLKSCEYFSYEVVNTEYNLVFRQNKYFFGGRLDALVKKGDEYYILDYKTGSAPKNPKYDFQTMIYLLAVNEFFNTDKITFVYLDLKNRECIKTEFSQELKEEYLARLNFVIEKIDSEDYRKIKDECSCEYKKICY
ncbi:PD-(D/E)XK nuclease family protein [bacterium]|nr:PD-(D/E)XK nuclease family protein [bacterium]